MAEALLSTGDEPIINLADHDRSGLQFAAGRSEVVRKQTRLTVSDRHPDTCRWDA
jgi:hypothetical protein